LLGGGGLILSFLSRLPSSQQQPPSLPSTHRHSRKVFFKTEPKKKKKHNFLNICHDLNVTSMQTQCIILSHERLCGSKISLQGTEKWEHWILFNLTLLRTTFTCAIENWLQILSLTTSNLAF
jgi:hypothetical protein